MEIETIAPHDIQIPSRDRWHEGTYLVGYWPIGDSYVLRGHDDHHLCVSAGFLRELFISRLKQVEERLLFESNGINPTLEDILEREERRDTQPD